jgi:hypothetical protein
MLFSTHAMVAGAVGKYLGNPVLAFLLGIVLHLVLDSIPHYDTTDDGKLTKRQLALVGFDIIVFILLVIFVVKPMFSLSNPFWWGAFGGVLPDLFDCVPFWNKSFRRTKFGKKFHRFHDKIQSVKVGPVPGILVQVLFLAVSIYFLIK